MPPDSPTRSTSALGSRRILTAAIRLYRRVGTEYPASSLTKAATTALVRLDTASAAVDVAASTPTKAPAAPRSSRPDAADHRHRGAAPSTRARLTSIDRAVLPDSVRITVALDQEVPYHEETLTGPARVFFDLRGVEATAPLADAVLRFPTDVVRQIRVGRHPNCTVRVVLDLDGVKRHSVYTLYNPFRLVIECEPEGVTTAKNNPKPVPLSEQPVIPTHLPTPVATAPPCIAATRPLPAVPTVCRRPCARAIDDRRADRGCANSAAPLSRDAGARSAGANGAGGFSLARQLGLGISRIVIDPGHGGHDPGAQARGLNEADLTLDIALRLEKLLSGRRRDGSRADPPHRSSTFRSRNEPRSPIARARTSSSRSTPTRAATLQRAGSKPTS